MNNRHLLIVWHSRTGASEAMARAAAQGAGSGASMLAARDVEANQLLSAAGFLFVCPENLAAMSGEMKEMFDRTYYPVLGQVEGRAYATAIAAGSDGEGAQRQIDRIARGWRLKRVADPVIVCTHAQSREAIERAKVLHDSDLERCRDLGKTLASGIALGIF